jgi:hypothetical protein
MWKRGLSPFPHFSCLVIGHLSDVTYIDQSESPIGILSQLSLSDTF